MLVPIIRNNPPATDLPAPMAAPLCLPHPQLITPLAVMKGLLPIKADSKYQKGGFCSNVLQENKP